MKQPTQCHLWQAETLTPDDLYGCFDTLEEFGEEDTHLRRSLMRCKSCGQLYYYEFHEWIDWTGGNDPQYRTWIPVESREEIDALNQTSPLTLLKFLPRLQSDFPKDTNEPKVFWVGRER
ncbi:MAG TPA: hypothetical protein VHN74_08030 [Candidatus Angelobacter sp.]|jgi:hypothetical protein|nr:hypothetical protein [Candidatus Angelobacter sp.]